MSKWQFVIRVNGKAIANVEDGIGQLVDAGNQGGLTVSDGGEEAACIAGVIQGVGPGVGRQEGQSV
jgi:hypothetical protein